MKYVAIRSKFLHICGGKVQHAQHTSEMGSITNGNWPQSGIQRKWTTFRSPLNKCGSLIDVSKCQKNVPASVDKRVPNDMPFIPLPGLSFPLRNAPVEFLKGILSPHKVRKKIVFYIGPLNTSLLHCCLTQIRNITFPRKEMPKYQRLKPILGKVSCREHHPTKYTFPP